MTAKPIAWESAHPRPAGLGLAPQAPSPSKRPPPDDMGLDRLASEIVTDASRNPSELIELFDTRQQGE